MLAAGRLDEAAGLERQAWLLADAPGGGREERRAVLVVRADRLTRAGDRRGALEATRGALELTDDPAAARDLRIDACGLRVGLEGAGALDAAEELVSDLEAHGAAMFPRARAQAVLARAREAAGDPDGARAAEARGRELLVGGPPAPPALRAALGEAPTPRPRRADGEPSDPRAGADRIEAVRPSERAASRHQPPRPSRPTPPAPTSPAPQSRAVDEIAYAAVLADLDRLVGLAAVKREVRRTAQLLRMRALRETAGLRVADVSLHLVFCGGPGTGKTTVARLLGRLYHALGLLATDRLVEVDRSGLVAGYVGKTAPKVNEVVDSALDGVLFVDEAYALAGGGPADFGPEAISALLKRMEDDRHRLAVVCAGYTTEMEAFLTSNSGLASRFAETITFDDYAPDELVAILERFCAASDYLLADDARAAVAELLGDWHASRDATFANARTVRNLFDDLIAAQADRLLGAGPAPDAEAMRRLTAEDVATAEG